ncbi:TPA: ABC transporter [Candidatus Uhrbacteria bacterium]|nr:ABC transporter [Candidatus Uhrbacteria bacterium]
MAKPLLEARGICKSFGKQTVLKDVSLLITEGKKIALIGRNGAGKSTLVKILLGETEADTGEVTVFDRTHIGVVHQQEVLPADVSTLAYLEAVGGKPSWEVKKLGAKFGLHTVQLEKPPSTLSGGYQMRVKLVAMFLQEPTLLFLDEPVNYLDLQTLLLLETVLAEYRGSFLLIAHDRTFLQNTCDTVYEIERGELTTYNGDVQSYLAWKAEQLEFVKRTNKKLSREIEHHQSFVDRFGAKASLATRAQNKMKQISKLRSQIQKIDVNLATARIKITSSHVHPGLAIRARELSIGYPGHTVAQSIDFSILRGEKVVIAGENGRGKSTLLKTLVGQLEPLAGEYKWWKHAAIGNYDQLTSESLSEKDTVLSHLMQCAPGHTSSEQILMMAGNFLFQGDDLDKRVSVLSGGERARLALAGVLLQEHTVLILDEPTNHLDVETEEGLALALKAYKGTVVFVSHARTFVSALADRILEVRHGSVREFNGPYEEYVQEVATLMELESQVDGVENPDETRPEKERIQRRENHERIKDLQRSIKRLEGQIAILETEKSGILKFFFDNPTDYAPSKAQRLEEIKGKILLLEKQWIRYQEEIEIVRE